MFAGDPRVWRAAVLAAVPLFALAAFYCLRPRDYYTGTNNVEAYTYVIQTPAGAPVCVPGLHIPAGTGRLRLQLISQTRVRPALKMALTTGGPHQRTVAGALGPLVVPANRISAAVFTIPALPAAERASLCLTAAGVVNWGGTPLLAVPSPDPPTASGRPLAARIAVWYLPAAGAQRSYLSRAGPILRRASLFRPGFVGPWLYVLILLVLLPAAGARGRALSGARCRRSHAAPARGLGVRHRRSELRVLGAHNASFSGPGRGRSLRLHAVARRARSRAVAQPRIAAGALVEL